MSKEKLFEPVMGKSWCYHTMKSAKDKVDKNKHDWKVKQIDVRNSYNT